MGSEMYQSFLDRFDEDSRGTAEEVFKEWDGNVTRKFQEIHEEYKPYKELIDGYDPEVLGAGVQLLEQLRDNPRAVYDNIGSHFKWNNDSNNNGNVSDDNNQTTGQSNVPMQNRHQAIPDERYSNLEKQLQQLQSVIQEQQMNVQRQNELQQFNNYLDTLSQKYGDYDRDWVLGKIASGIEPEIAVQSYIQWYEKVTGRQFSSQQEQNAPGTISNILGSGGGTANQAFDPAKMTRTQTQEFISNMLSNVEQT